MKKTIVLALMAMAIVAVPATAQTRKEKKAAEKAQWEQAQQFAAEEAALRHQMKMDSLANAQKVAEEQRRAAEAQAAADKAAAEAKAKAEAEAKAAQEVEVVEYCADYYSTKELIRGKGIGEDFDQQMSTDMARVAALEELSSQVETKVQSLVLNYKNSKRVNLTRESKQYMQGLTKLVVDNATGFRIVCRKTTSYVLNGDKLYKSYMVLEIGADELLKPLYEGLQQEEDLNLDYDYEKFKEEFEKEFAQQ